jgi:threonyl-tRNA synthetase
MLIVEFVIRLSVILTRRKSMSVEAELENSVQYSPLQRMRHSAAHVMAQAVQEMFPGAKFATGPAIDDGFYYDFDLPRPLTPADFPEIEQRMTKIIAGKYPFVRDHWSRLKALEYFSQKGQPYKVEIIENLPEDEKAGVYQQQNDFPELCRVQESKDWPGEVTIYQQHNFLDLCRGPHVEHTGQIGPFKLMRVAGAYWRGDEHRPMLQRLYGTAWFTQEELDQYLYRLEEAQKRDHRKLGRELGLFMMSAEVGSGLPLWLPKGAILRETLENFLRQEQRNRGYVPVMTPHISLIEMFKTSGHWQKYRDEMYPSMQVNLEANSPAGEEEARGETYMLRPMNCPHHIQIYQSELRSYRDLPLRLAEFGMVYRLEKAGELHGLLRSRGFTIDDSHIFALPDQLDDEFISVVDFVRFVFAALGISDYRARVGLRDPASSKYVGSDEVWATAQSAIIKALDKLGFPYTLEQGEAGFYGPKLDFVFRDALNREWQLGTIQVDYNLPERFDLWYIGEDGQRHRPVMIHRAPGSIERLVAILIEHYAGAFPVWLAPVQVRIITIADRHIPYAQEVMQRLLDQDIRVELDHSPERMNAKIRAAQLQKIPYMLVIGDKEQKSQSVSVRLRTNQNLGVTPLDTFIARITNIIKTKSKEL